MKMVMMISSESTCNQQLDLAVTTGIRHIGIGVYSSGKIYEYLVRKGFEPHIAHTAVKELVERKYIDDLRAGRKVLYNRSGRKQESRSLLYKRLLQAGIAEDKADELITRTRDDNETCLDLVKAAYPVIPDEVLEGDAYEFIEELMKLCARRGYNPSVSKNAISNWIQTNYE